MKTVLGVDPGSSKVGLAVVQSSNDGRKILLRGVVEIPNLRSELNAYLRSFKINFAVIGNGTNSKKVQEMIRECAPGLSILILDERDTSIRARERYWEHHPRRGWRRLLPSSLQVPPEPIDDFVAVILAENALSVD
jgi:RNase H-fold protein (predicted Holliday junction resolvase)